MIAALTSGVAQCQFYGPERPLFEKSWKLPDIEKVTR
jgi:hypothetical protein